MEMVDNAGLEFPPMPTPARDTCVAGVVDKLEAVGAALETIFA